MNIRDPNYNKIKIIGQLELIKDHILIPKENCAECYNKHALTTDALLRRVYDTIGIDICIKHHLKEKLLLIEDDLTEFTNVPIKVHIIKVRALAKEAIQLGCTQRESNMYTQIIYRTNSILCRYNIYTEIALLQQVRYIRKLIN